MEPSLVVNKEDPSSNVPLSSCTPDQTEELLTQLNEKLNTARRCGMTSVCDQLQFYVNMVEERIYMFESGEIKKPNPKKVSYKNIKILEDE